MKLLRAAPRGSFLIVRIVGSQDLMQVQQDAPALRLSFPQTNRRQRTQRRPFEVACLIRRLKIERVEEEDSSLFLEAPLKGDDEAVAAHILGLLCATFGTQRDTPFELEAEGFALPAPRV
ncbi:MAG: hypothetical protein AAF415_12030 [Pseudomonadota bacterium]